MRVAGRARLPTQIAHDRKAQSRVLCLAGVQSFLRKCLDTLGLLFYVVGRSGCGADLLELDLQAKAFRVLQGVCVPKASTCVCIRFRVRDTDIRQNESYEEDGAYLGASYSIPLERANCFALPPSTM